MEAHKWEYNTFLLYEFVTILFISENSACIILLKKSCQCSECTQMYLAVLYYFTLSNTRRFYMLRSESYDLLGGCRGVLFFMIKQKIIRDKMRYSNLSNNMMISEL